MGKRLLCCLLLLPLCLTACGGGEEDSELITEEYQELSGAAVEAELICHYDEEERRYTLHVDWSPEKSRVEVTAPEELAGIAATVDGETLTLTYDDVLLDAGEYSGTELSPMWAVPSMLKAIAEGYPLEVLREDVGEEPCLVITFEVTDAAEKTTYYTLWFGEDTLPRRGEITYEEDLVYEVLFTEFTKEGDGNGAAAAEDLGGN